MDGRGVAENCGQAALPVLRHTLRRVASLEEISNSVIPGENPYRVRVGASVRCDGRKESLTGRREKVSRFERGTMGIVCTLALSL